MPYRYIVKWRKAPNEVIRVEAWPKDKTLALPEERSKPSFIIGEVKGTRTIMLWQAVRDLTEKYGHRQRGRTTRIDLPKDDIQAIADAYRLGLAAAALNHIKSDESAEHALRYIMRTTQEEIWFWASKYLGVIDEAIDANRVVEALCIIGSA